MKFYVNLWCLDDIRLLYVALWTIDKKEDNKTKRPNVGKKIQRRLDAATKTGTKSTTTTPAAACSVYLSQFSDYNISIPCFFAPKIAVIQYIFYWHSAGVPLYCFMLLYVYGWSYNCLEWLKYMNKQRRAHIHWPHNCLSACRTNDWTPLFDFKQANKKCAIFSSVLLHSLTRSPACSLTHICLLLPWLMSAYIVVLSLIFVYFPIASVL